VITALVADEGVTAEVTVTRWHPVAEEWRDATLPLPATRAEEDREYQEREAAETEEAREEGVFDWRVMAEVSSRDVAGKLARKLSDEGLPASRRWCYVTIGAATEERAEELATRLRADLGDDADVWIEASLDDVAFGPFQFVGF
jgi:hypothetical protein